MLEHDVALEHLAALEDLLAEMKWRSPVGTDTILDIHRRALETLRATIMWHDTLTDPDVRES